MIQYACEYVAWNKLFQVWAHVSHWFHGRQNALLLEQEVSVYIQENEVNKRIERKILKVIENKKINISKLKIPT